MKKLLTSLLASMTILSGTVNVQATKSNNSSKIALVGISTTVVSGVVCATISATIVHYVMKDKLDKVQEELKNCKDKAAIVDELEKFFESGIVKSAASVLKNNPEFMSSLAPFVLSNVIKPIDN